MSVRKIDKPEAGQYLSGLANDGWEHLNDLGVRSSLERMESRSLERFIIPGERRLFLFVLSGALRAENGRGELRIGQGEAVEAEPGTTLTVRNASARPAQYLLISAQRTASPQGGDARARSRDDIVRAA